MPIEPTAAFLRDPRKCWSQMTETWTQSKDYLVPLSLDAAACPAIRGELGACTADGARSRQRTRRSQWFLFDAGATLPTNAHLKMNDWSGTGWLHAWCVRRADTSL